MATTKEIRDRAFKEVIGIPPARVKGAKRNQGEKKAKEIATAIALDRARARGAKIPKP